MSASDGGDPIGAWSMDLLSLVVLSCGIMPMNVKSAYTDSVPIDSPCVKSDGADVLISNLLSPSVDSIGVDSICLIRNADEIGVYFV